MLKRISGPVIVLALLSNAAAGQTVSNRVSQHQVGGGCSSLASDGDLEGWWEFDNDATDSSARGNDLTENGSIGYGTTSPAPQAGTHRSGNSDSNGKYYGIADASLSVDFPFSDGTTTTDATWGGWIQMTNTSGGDEYMHKANDIMLSTSSGTVRCVMGNDASERVDSDSTFSADVWIFAVCILDSGTLSMRIDGVTQAETETGLTATSNTFEFSLVGNSTGDADGYGDEMFMFKRVLTDAEIDCIESGSLDQV